MFPRQSVPIPVTAAPLRSIIVFLFVVVTILPAPAQVLFGTRYGNDGQKMQNVSDMEHWLGKKNSVILMYTNWCDDLTARTLLFNTLLPNIWNNGNVPVVTWEPATCSTTPVDIDIQIANGSYDAFMAKWAAALKTFLAGPDGIYGNGDDRRIFIRFAHEMNGNWYPWSANASQSPTDYIAMWKHVQNYMDNAGFDKWHVQWMWSVNGNDVGNFKAEQYYPGDSYVDWLAIDAYNFGYSTTSPASSSWPAPSTLFGGMLTRFAALSPNKPVAISETGCTSSAVTGTDVNAKNQWVQDAYNYLSSQNIVKMIVYFNQDKQRDWAVFGGSLGESTYQSGSTTYNVYSGYKSVLSNSTFVSTDPGNPQLLSDSLFMASAPSSSQTAPAPTVTEVSPNSGSTSGGTQVTITGTGFATGATVKIGGVGASSVSVVNATSISAVTPAGSAGAADVTVTNSDGQSGTLSAAFSYNAPPPVASAPTVTSITPNSGTSDGGTLVTINGTGFQSGATVTFDGIPGTNVSVANGTTLTSKHIVVVVEENHGFNAVFPNGVTGSGSPMPWLQQQAIANTVFTNYDANSHYSIPNYFWLVSGAYVTHNDSTGCVPGVDYGCTTTSPATFNVDSIVRKMISAGKTWKAYGESLPSVGYTGYNVPTGCGASGNACTYVKRHFPAAYLTDTQSGTQNQNLVPFTQFAADMSAGNLPQLSLVTPNLQNDAHDGSLGTADSWLQNNIGPLLNTAPFQPGGDGLLIITDDEAESSDCAPSSTCPTLPADVGGGHIATVFIGPQVKNGSQISTLYQHPNLLSTLCNALQLSSCPGAAATAAPMVVAAASDSNSTVLTVTAPAHSAGKVDVVVTNPDGQSATATGAFTYTTPPAPAPTISGVSPSSGSTNGGTAVTLTGTGFGSGATVSFGGVSATSVSVTNSTSITATSPAHTPGTVDVVVTNGDGQTATANGAFSYVSPPPTVSSVSPNSGSTSGGTQVTITGTEFSSGATVTFGGAAAAGVSVTGGTTLVATTPAHAAGTVDVVVTNSDSQAATAAGAFSYVSPTPPPAPPPSITGISPISGSTSGGTVVTIGGSGFQQGASVLFGGVAAAGVTVTSNSILATTPAHVASAVDVVVTNTDSQSATATGAYTYVAPPPSNPPPTVSTLTPTSGSTNGGTAVTITGTGFQLGATVSFGGTAATAITVSSSTSLTATTSAHSAGTVDVTVSNPDGQKGTASASYTYVAPPPGTSPPTISSLSVTSGSTAGGTAVKITGTNFRTGVTVKFGGTAATNISVTSSTSISATTPKHAAGAVDVVVTNADGTSATLAAANVLLNPGFEKGSASWAFSGTGKASVLNVSGRAHTGAYYAELTSSAGQHPVFNPLTSTGATAYFAVKPGQTVNFSSWAYRVSGNGYARLSLAAYDTNKANPTYLVTTPSNVSTASWSLQKSTYAVPTGKAYVRVYLEIYQNTSSSVARFDDVSLVTGGFTYK